MKLPKPYLRKDSAVYWFSYKHPNGEWLSRSTGCRDEQGALAVIAEWVAGMGYGLELKPAARLRRAPLDEASAGCVYAINLVPEHPPWRIKVGWTGARSQGRIRSYVTACPTMEVLGVWPGRSAGMETHVLTALERHCAGRQGEQRVRESEVFVVLDVEAFLCEIDAAVSSWVDSRAELDDLYARGIDGSNSYERGDLRRRLLQLDNE